MKRCRGKTFLLLATLVCLVWVIPAAALDSSVRIVRLSYISGDVQLDRQEGRGYERAILNMPIVQGSRLWTRGDDALAEVEFEDGSTLRLTPGTTVEFQELSLRGSGEKVTSVDRQNGTAYFDVRNRMGDFRVTAGGQQISVAHAARFRVFHDNGQFKVADYKGNLDVRSGDHQIAIRSGETLTLDLSDPSHYNLAKSISEGAYDNWDQERESYTESYNSASTYSGDSYYSGFSPAYSYGLADLAYYGNYFYAPGWGWMWRPYYVGAGWNPFMDGAWAWYPQFGYMWISPYPWGWMPYRYGYWNFVPGYGWCWFPTTTWNRWAPVTAVNRPPVNWVPVRPPATAPKPGTPTVVTVGRTWGTVYPPGAVARPLPGSSVLPSTGTSTAPSHPVWGAPGSITGKGATTTNNSATTSTAPPAAATKPAPSTTVPAKPATPPVPRVSRDSDTPHVRQAPSNKLSTSSASPRSQMRSPSASPHSWGGEHAGGFSGGGHSGGGWGGHDGGHH